MNLSDGFVLRPMQSIVHLCYRPGECDHNPFACGSKVWKNTPRLASLEEYVPQNEKARVSTWRGGFCFGESQFSAFQECITHAKTSKNRRTGVDKPSTKPILRLPFLSAEAEIDLLSGVLSAREKASSSGSKGNPGATRT